MGEEANSASSLTSRGDWTRTSDPLHPMQVRYRAALHPEFPCPAFHSGPPAPRRDALPGCATPRVPLSRFRRSDRMFGLPLGTLDLIGAANVMEFGES